MKTKTNSAFTRKQYNRLTGEQKQAVEAVAEYLNGGSFANEAKLSTEEIASTFNLLKASEGCVPIEEAGEELDQTIRRKFGALFQVAMELAEAELAKAGKKERTDFNFCMVVDPSYEDATHVVIVDYDKPICYLHEWQKAWHVGFSNLGELAGEVLRIKGRLVEQASKSRELMVVVEGGLVREVVNLPEPYCVTVVDYDIEDGDEEDIEKSPIDGEPCHIRKF